MTYVEIPINVSGHFEVDRLSIVPELVAAKHQFTFNGKNVSVSLPGPDREDLPFDQKKLHLRSWKAADNTPLEFVACSLTMEMELPGSINIPEEVRRLPPKQFKLFQPAERDALDHAVKEAGKELRAAHSYWLKVMRWKSGIGYIGEPRIDYGGDQQSATLCDRETGHRLWPQTGSIQVQASRPITAAEWGATQSALSAQKAVPIWFDYLFDSEMRLNNKDFLGAILSLAIALEANIRFIFFGELSNAGIDAVVVEVFDLTNLRALLTRLKKTKHWNDKWASAADLSTFHRLMDIRNNVMHLAKLDSFDEGEFRKLHKAVKTFAYFTSEALGLS